MKKLLLTFVTFIALMFFLPAVARAGEKDAEKDIVLLILLTTDNPFFADVERGFRAGVKDAANIDLHVRVGAKDREIMFERQILETYYSKYVEGVKDSRIKAVALIPAGADDELTAPIRSFRDAKIPVFIMDGKINAAALSRAHTDYTAYLGSSNRDGGRLAAELISRCLPRGGRVLVLNGTPASEPAVERRAGFIEKITELGQANSISYEFAERIGNWKRAEGHALVDGFYSLGKGFDGIFAANDMMALGALEAVRKYPDAKPPVIVGFDAVDEVRQLVKEGKIAGTIAQDPYRIGNETAQLVMQVLAGKTVPKDTAIPVLTVTEKGGCAYR